ncbi:6-phospho-beta-glucosidase [Proteiniborus sp. MB09-C3]|uniref:6-phospho-beta-glucosidase n=1 Tax=Proteiniborus sp. MB09-C3 TaxID=3050072 RepID=UPI00255699C2|nr:6-phospho-beta-glucosidase [Proteiniborus sp. MB09-C3]WIV11597.1 6-phospho-beta-glucosidase [Proteiniborus sp. MB09-C3]
MKGLKIAVIGGGSSYTPELIDGFIKRVEELPVKELCLVDIEEGRSKLEIVGNLAKRMVKKAGLDIQIKLTLNRKEAIKDADFVLTQLRVGGLAARARDEHIPLKYNVLGQETTGAGGFAKAMRTIPVILDICRDIETLSPNAWLINFTNPAGLITETILKYANVKAIGLCNVPIHMVKNTAELLEVDSSRLQIEFAGLNHLVWGRKVYLDGKDITDKVINMLCDGASLTMKNITDLNWDKDYLRALSMIPCPYHRYFYMTDEMIDDMKTALATGEGTRADQVQKVEKELFEIYADESLDIKPPQLEKRGGAYYSDAAVSLISAIYNNKKEIHTVNVRNNGAILNQPEDVVVEVNAVIDSNGAHPIAVGKLPPEISGLISSVKAYELLSVEAGVTGDYNTALKALIAHPLVPSVKTAKLILDDIIRENRGYLPQFE